ncbi:ParB/RepB/Spo0J family partition protein [Sporolactobacillus terrae]|uniref:Helix-turn-helix domain-containing protein n=1 Tax=Sporolactobacillus terrae TaxID=269673 RepID=A0ABX5QBC2_9BACL|nr:ParB/RepB/Spo0J family partition protein [Sporolactobacillus terrae]QAA23904.1 helix-turn-helix domain-containing protein [Sporolactobacillus terrae]UAK15934.1 ParB/RepB/Spo0J family partition protein [Sporolactobacillus terrae]
MPKTPKTSKALGKGLDAFFPSAFREDLDNAVEHIKLDEMRPNPYQPRKTFDSQALEELTQSIKAHGIIQPLVVRKSIKGYDIVVGERRFRAAKQAQMKTVPVVVKELSDEAMMQIALIENLQRENLNPMEEATAYKKLMNGLKMTQDELAKKLGKSRPHIANYLRLLQLPTDAADLIKQGKLSMGHGRALVGLKDKKQIKPVVQKVLKEQLNVRQLETLVQQLNHHVPRETTKKKKWVMPPELRDHVSSLREKYGTSVKIKPGLKKGKGKIELDYYSSEDLYRLIEIMEGRL